MLLGWEIWSATGVGESWGAAIEMGEEGCYWDERVGIGDGRCD